MKSLLLFARRLRLTTALLLVMANAAAAQNLARAFIAKDGKAHVVFRNGAEMTIAPQQKQVGCEGMSIASDSRTVGWSILVENCCTSYPIPMAVIVFRDGRQTLITSELMIHEWRFVGGGNRVATLVGQVHGYAIGANLYNARNGKLLESWNGEGEAPQWAESWEERFEPASRNAGRKR